MTRSASIFFSAILLPALVHAANDWSVPCFRGQCSWDVASSTGGSGGLTLSGSSNAISDITTAAGWEILGCETSGTSTKVRIVCSSDDTAAAGCDHLTQNGGAVNKIVRLPESCGTVPFARVASSTISPDQTIPAKTAARLSRRSTSTRPQVKALSLDTKWHLIPVSSNGNVSLAISGANVPGVGAVASNTASRRHSRFRLGRRGLFGDVVSSVANAVSSVGNAVDGAAHDVASAVSGVAKAAANLDSFNETKTFNLEPINVNKTFTIFNNSIECSRFDAAVDVSADTVANAQLNVGVAAIGTIVPPALTDFQLVAGGNADLNGVLNLDASALGEFATGVLTLFSIGIPGFDIPGIFSLGPTFDITAQATASIDLDINMQVGLSYSVQNLQLFFPPSSAHQSSADATPQQSPLQLALSPSVAADGSITVHLTPTLNLGLNVFDNKVAANVFIDLDAALEMDLALNASSFAETNGFDNSTSTGSIGSQLAQNGAFDGCVDLEGTISGNAGADASFFNLFDPSKQVTIFSKTFPIFSKCFSGGEGEDDSSANSTASDLGNSTVTGNDTSFSNDTSSDFGNSTVVGNDTSTSSTNDTVGDSSNSTSPSNDSSDGSSSSGSINLPHASQGGIGKTRKGSTAATSSSGKSSAKGKSSGSKGKSTGSKSHHSTHISHGGVGTDKASKSVHRSHASHKGRSIEYSPYSPHFTRDMAKPSYNKRDALEVLEKRFNFVCPSVALLKAEQIASQDV